MKTTPEGMLTVHAVMDRPIAEGSLVEVLLLDPWKRAPDIQAEYDLAALGEVEDIHGPFCNPPRWMVSYREKVSAECGDRIQSKEGVNMRISYASLGKGLSGVIDSSDD